MYSKFLIIVTSYEHWLGHENSQLVDDISRCIGSNEEVTGVSFNLTVKTNYGTEYRCVNYFIAPLKFNKELDEILKEKAPVKKVAHRPSAAFAEIENLPSAGIVIIMQEVTSKTFLIESLAKQVSISVMNEFKENESLLEGDVKQVTVLNIDIRGCKIFNYYSFKTYAGDGS